MQCKREAVVYDDGAGHGLYHTEILFVDDTCVKKIKEILQYCDFYINLM